MLGKVFFVVLSCSLLLNPLATYAREGANKFLI